NSPRTDRRTMPVAAWSTWSLRQAAAQFLAPPACAGALVRFQLVRLRHKEVLGRYDDVEVAAPEQTVELPGCASAELGPDPGVEGSREMSRAVDRDHHFTQS